MSVASATPAWGGWAIAAVCAVLVAQIAWNSRRLRLNSFEDVLSLLPDLGLLLIGAAMAVAAAAVVRPLWAAIAAGAFFLGIFFAKLGTFCASYLLAPNAFRIRELAGEPDPNGRGPCVAVTAERSPSPWQAASGICVGCSLLVAGAVALIDAYDIPSAGIRWLLAAFCLVGAIGAIAYGVLALNDPAPAQPRQLLLAAEWFRLPGSSSPLAWADVVEIKPAAQAPRRHATESAEPPRPDMAVLEFVGAGGDSLGKLSAGALPRPERAASALGELHRDAGLRAELSRPGGATRLKRLLGLRPLL